MWFIGWNKAKGKDAEVLMLVIYMSENILFYL